LKIGVFDSGYGGLTILSKIRERLPGYDYIYLGDNARAPYGTRSFQVIYEYTLQAVRYLQAQGCRLIILACNTASAKALRTIQQHDIDPDRLRVLGVIRPTVEVVPSLTRNGHIGILATPGTVSSESYVIELQHQMAAMNEKISTINYRTALADRSRLSRDKNYQLSTINYQLFRSDKQLHRRSVKVPPLA
jgi:glutamate racemase